MEGLSDVSTHVLMTRDERTKLRKQARACDVTLSEYVRAMLDPKIAAYLGSYFQKRKAAP